MGTVWLLVLGLGTIALGVIMWLAVLRNRKHETPAELARTDAGTREIYAREDAEDHQRDVSR